MDTRPAPPTLSLKNLAHTWTCRHIQSEICVTDCTLHMWSVTFDAKITLCRPLTLLSSSTLGSKVCPHPSNCVLGTTLTRAQPLTRTTPRAHLNHGELHTRIHHHNLHSNQLPGYGHLFQRPVMQTPPFLHPTISSCSLPHLLHHSQT